MENFLVKVFLSLFLILSLSDTYSQDAIVKRWKLNCVPEESCLEFEERITDEFENNILAKEIIKNVKQIALEQNIDLFEVLLKEDDQGPILVVNISKKKNISSLVVEADPVIDTEKIEQLIGFRGNDFYYDGLEGDIRRKVKKYLEERGFLEVDIKAEKNEVSSSVEYKISVLFKDTIKVKSVSIESGGFPVQQGIRLKLLSLKDNIYNSVDTKILSDEVAKEFFNEGYTFSKVDLQTLNKSGQENEIDLVFKIVPGWRINLNFNGNKTLSRDDLLLKIRNRLSNDGKITAKEELIKEVIQLYEERGIYNNKINLRIVDGKYKNQSPFKNLYFEIVEGKKVPVKDLIFQGNLKVTLDRIKELFYKEATALASRDFLDQSYFDKFSSILKEYYLRNGFIFAEVSKPQITFNNLNNESEAFYSIKERQQCILSNIETFGLPLKLRNLVLKELINKEGAPLNVIDLEKDLVAALNVVREAGYYFAQIKNLSQNSLITYSSNYTSASLNFKFDIGKEVRFNDILVSGNKKTDKIVLKRELNISQGDLITPQKIKDFRNKLSSLGLFGRIQIVPFVINRMSNEDFYRINLLVQLEERKFGTWEVAPGYRTDIGAKISTTLTFKNLWGLNHSASMKLQTNRRFSLSEMDSRRKASGRHLLEGQFKFGYTYPYFLFNAFDSASISASLQRKRFSSFDADILRLSPQLTKSLTDKVSASLKYQFEQIRQFDATELKDDAKFRIGGITPSISFDTRDNTVSTRSGVFIGLSWEFANETFFSKKEEDLEINFSKIISRNRFYYPLFEKQLVLAFSLSAGYQKNFADELVYNEDGSVATNPDGTKRTTGYIPSIKVFRLDGVDAVRGFADSEINRLDTGVDINELRIQNLAFFANFKFEPRYYMSDTMALGVFFDAGKLYVNHFRPLSLRTAVGLSFKFLTQVGTLDFDYGVKTKRRRLNDGGREGFGRFHLSIGYF